MDGSAHIVDEIMVYFRSRSLRIMLGFWSSGVIDWSLLHSLERSKWSIGNAIFTIMRMSIYLTSSRWGCFGDLWWWGWWRSLSWCGSEASLSSLTSWSLSNFKFMIIVFQSVSLSENDLLACCGFECGDGCEGGYPIRAWQYFKRTGVVTSKVHPLFLIHTTF